MVHLIENILAHLLLVKDHKKNICNHIENYF